MKQPSIPNFTRMGEKFTTNLSVQANLFLNEVSAIVLEAVAVEKEKNNDLKALAGSIAHELCNPLFQIHGILYLLLEQLPNLNNNEHINNIQRLINGALQAIDITLDAIMDKPIDR